MHMLPICIVTVVCSAIHIRFKGTTLRTILYLTHGSDGQDSLVLNLLVCSEPQKLRGAEASKRTHNEDARPGRMPQAPDRGDAVSRAAA